MEKRQRVCGLLLVVVVLLVTTGCNLEVWVGPVPTNQSPIVAFTVNPTTGVAPLEVNFDASSSFDSDGNIVSWQWDFGDGYKGSGRQVNHQYNDDSDFNNDGQNEGYLVTLTVTDDDGASSSCSRKIYVANPSPVALFTVSPSNTVLTKEMLTFDAATSYDPASLEKKGIVPGPDQAMGTIVSYQWDFGDGYKGSGRQVNHQYNDDSDFNNDGQNEGYLITLTITDDDGAIASCSKRVYIDNRPPVAVVSWNTCPVASNAIDIKGIVPGPTDICIELSAESSYDIDGYITSCQWFYKNELVTTGNKFSVSLTSGVSYPFKLVVFDDDGAKAEIVQIVTP